MTWFRQWLLIPMVLGVFAYAHLSGGGFAAAVMLAVLLSVLGLSVANIVGLTVARLLGFTVPIVVSSGWGPCRTGRLGQTTVIGSTVPVYVAGSFGHDGDEGDLSVPRYLAASTVAPLVAAVTTILAVSVAGADAVMLVVIWIVAVPLLVPIRVWRSLGVFSDADRVVRARLVDQLRAGHHGARMNLDPRGALAGLEGHSGPHHLLSAASAQLVLGDRAAAVALLHRIPRPAPPPMEEAIDQLRAMATAAQGPASSASALRLAAADRNRMDPVVLVAAVEAAVATGDVDRARKAKVDFDRLAEWLPLHPALGQRLMDAYRHAGEPARLPAAPPEGPSERKKALMAATLTIGFVVFGAVVLSALDDDSSECEPGADRWGGRCVDGMVIVSGD